MAVRIPCGEDPVTAVAGVYVGGPVLLHHEADRPRRADEVATSLCHSPVEKPNLPCDWPPDAQPESLLLERIPHDELISFQ